MRPATVRMRLTVLAALIVGAGLIAGGAAQLMLIRQNLVGNARNDAVHRAQATAAILHGTPTPPRTLPSTGEDTAVVQVVDRHGRVLTASEELDGKGPLLSRWPSEGAPVSAIQRVPVGEGTDHVVVGLAASLAGEPVAVYAASSLEPADEGVAAAMAGLAVVVPALLVLVTALAWQLIGRSLRPVEAMRREAAEITATELRRRLPVPAEQDEIARLARTMNEMLARLQEAHERERRFADDASHELRSPLATIRTRLEVGLAHPIDTDWVRLARTVHREGTRLENLVDDLLLLSRSRATAQDTRLVDLDELVLLEVEAIRARGRVGVELSPFTAARLHGRPDELRRMIRNLLDNAERHAAQRIVVGLTIGDGAAELVVADDGDGIPADCRERVFERFFRLQPARDRDSGGTGLGLAIVREVATGHGGRARVAATETGAELHIRLPLMESGGGSRGTAA